MITSIFEVKVAFMALDPCFLLHHLPAM